MMPKIIIGVVILFAGLFLVGSRFRDMKPPDFTQPPKEQHQPTQQQGNQQAKHDLGEGINKPFYEKDGLYLTHTWPGERNFSNEETEILVFNESEDIVEVKSFDLTYSVVGKAYPHKSGTWEKFPSSTSWERSEYIMISKQYYKGEPLDLARGEKGKLHWHINFGKEPLDGKQTVNIKLTLLRDGETVTIDEEFSRNSGKVYSTDQH